MARAPWPRRLRIVAESAVCPSLAARWPWVQADITYWLVQFTEPVLADIKPSKLVEGTGATRITHALVPDESPNGQTDLTLAPGVAVYPVRGNPSSVADAEPFPGEGVKAFVRHSDFDEGRV